MKATEESLRGTLTFSADRNNGFAKTLLIFPSDATSPSDKCAGFALFFYNYSTWQGRPGVFLEDLFVRPPFRGKGYGKLLLKRLAIETLAIGGKRLDWNVLKWNKPSIDFYESSSIGAQRLHEWVGCRLEGEELKRMGTWWEKSELSQKDFQKHSDVAPHSLRKA